MAVEIRHRIHYFQVTHDPNASLPELIGVDLQHFFPQLPEIALRKLKLFRSAVNQQFLHEAVEPLRLGEERPDELLVRRLFKLLFKDLSDGAYPEEWISDFMGHTGDQPAHGSEPFLATELFLERFDLRQIPKYNDHSFVLAVLIEKIGARIPYRNGRATLYGNIDSALIRTDILPRKNIGLGKHLGQASAHHRFLRGLEYGRALLIYELYLPGHVEQHHAA